MGSTTYSWAGFCELALPLAMTDEGMRQKTLSLVVARAFKDKPNSQTAPLIKTENKFLL